MRFVDIGAQTDRIVRRAHGEYAAQIRACNGGNKGNGTRGNDELIICNALTVGKAHGFGGGIKTDCLHFGLHLYAGQSRVLFGRVDDQLLAGLNAPSDIVGKTATGVGDVLAFGVNGDFCTAILSL